MTPLPDQPPTETLEEIADQLIETWFDAPDGYRGMVLLDEERASLRRLIVAALVNRDERAVRIINDHQAMDVCKDNCWTTIKAAIREGK